MRVIAWVELICDGCGKSLRVLAPKLTPVNRLAEKRLTLHLAAMADRNWWHMEGHHSLYAGDECDKCWTAEKILLNQT